MTAAARFPQSVTPAAEMVFESLDELSECFVAAWERRNG